MKLHVIPLNVVRIQCRIMSGAVCGTAAVLSGWCVCLTFFSWYSQDQESGSIISAAVDQYDHLGFAACGELWKPL